jgi:DNA-3-methyladenine glycosylase II
MNLEIKKVLQHFDKKDKKISKILENVNFAEWFKTKPHTEQELFLSLCRIIVGQQLSGKAANAIFNKFSNVFTKTEVTPQKVLKKTDQELRDTGLSWAKVRYIKDLAQSFVEKRIKFTQLEQLTDEEVITELVKVKGIGRWSAEMYLMFTLHRLDVFAFDDLGLSKGLEKLYKITKTDRTKAEKIIKKWAPYKTYGAIALWTSLEG